MFKYVFLCACSLGLVGCATVDSTADLLSFGGDELYCPDTAILADASSVTVFDGQNNIEYHAAMSVGEEACIIEDNAVIVNFSLNIEGQKGESEEGLRAYLDYFVAVLDYNGTILERDSFPIGLIFGADEARTGMVAELQQNITIGHDRVAEDYSIIVGFELSREQAIYNRR